MASNNSDPIPEPMRRTIQELGRVWGLTPEQVPTFVNEWLEDIEAKWLYVAQHSAQEMPDRHVRNHNTIIKLTHHNYVTGAVSEAEIDLSLLSEDDLEAWRGSRDGDAEILFRMREPRS